MDNEIEEALGQHKKDFKKCLDAVKELIVMDLNELKQDLYTNLNNIK